MSLTRSLSGRLLMLTITIVMVTEVLVFLPSVARYREDFLRERLQMAQIASLALLAADDEMVEETLEAELLANAGVTSIVLRRDSVRQLVLRSPDQPQIAATYDLRGAVLPALGADALAALVQPAPRQIRVIGQPRFEAGEVIEITMSDAELLRAVRAFGQRILLLSLMISGVTGVLIFLICRRLIVRPIARVVDNMVAFQADPEGAPAIRGGSGIDEIARAETALGEMQAHVRGALRQKTRLAELGAAVAKISHDLRNMLASAQLMADRLEGSQDPTVARVGPKLVGALDRAVNLCVSTLKHGKAEEAPAEPRRVALAPLVDEVGETVFGEDATLFRNEVAPGLEAEADPEHLFRILVNLVRNAREAILSSGRGDRVAISAARAGGRIRLTVADNGPGMPAKAMANIFQPFLGSASRGGAGLGLAIAHELAEANGGALGLVSSTTEGTTFLLTLPAPGAAGQESG